MTDTLLLVDGLREDALMHARNRDIDASYARSKFSECQTVLRASMDQYPKILAWWYEGGTLRRTTGIERPDF